MTHDHYTPKDHEDCAVCIKCFASESAWEARHGMHTFRCPMFLEDESYTDQPCECGAPSVHAECCLECEANNVVTVDGVTTSWNESNVYDRGHRFYPTTAEFETIPRLYETEATPVEQKNIVMRYFLGRSGWWIAEVDPTEMLAFGYACLDDPQNAEWGYVSLRELEALCLTDQDYSALLVRRDLWWEPRPASQCRLPGLR